MASLIPVHQISSDEDEEELDLILRINRNYPESIKSRNFESSISTQLNLQSETYQNAKSSKCSVLKEKFTKDIEISDDELPDICDASILFRNQDSSSDQPESIVTKSVINHPTLSDIHFSTKSSLSNKDAKLLERETKKREREKKREEKERLKKEKEEERMLKRATKPGECQKYILVQVDRQLLVRSEGSEIVSKMLTLELQYRALEQIIPNSISFLRKDPLTGDEHDEKEMIIILMIEDFLSLVYNQIYDLDHWSNSSSDTFCNRCSQWINCSYDSRITIIVCGLDEFYKSQKNKNRRNFKDNVEKENGKTLSGKPTKRKKNDDDIPHLTKVSRIDVETALVSAQVELGVNVRLFETPSKIAEFVGQVAKSVAERPYKLDKTCTDFSWHAESSNSNCVKIYKNGEGLLKLWHQQIRQFTNVGPETAQAIAKRYPSPQCLVKAYRELPVSEGRKLLAEIPVRRGVGVLANTRKVGIELSKKIYNFFMEEDPEIYL